MNDNELLQLAQANCINLLLRVKRITVRAKTAAGATSSVIRKEVI